MSSESLKNEIESRIHKTIPLSKAMGFKLERLSPVEVLSLLPLNPNVNHLGTQFGGSLYAVSALSCYSAVLGILGFAGQDVSDIVIAKGEIRYLSPGTEDCTVQVRIDEKAAKRFVSALRERGKGKLKLCAQVLQKERVVAEFHGDYAARASKN